RLSSTSWTKRVSSRKRSCWKRSRRSNRKPSKRRNNPSPIPHRPMRTKTRCALGAMALLGAAALASCHPLQKPALPGPPEFTVRAAPGAPGGPQDMAAEFLARAPFPPASKIPMHQGLCYAEPFFHDAAVDPVGRDTDRYNGVDTAHLFFSA